VPADAHGGSADLAGSLRGLLRLALEQTGLDAVLLTRQQGDVWLVIESALPDGLVPVGVSMEWSQSLCAQTVDGHAPQVTPDLAAVPVLRRAAETAGMEVGAFVCFPLRADDGSLLGTLCGVSARPLPPSLHDCAPLLRALAQACASLVAGELALSAGRAQADLLHPSADGGPRTGLLPERAWTDQLAGHADRTTRLGAQ
jgi:hypothetical protein